MLTADNAPHLEPPEGEILTTDKGLVSAVSLAPIPCVETAPAAVLAELDRLGCAARDYVSQSRAENTKRAYRADWADFDSWCRERGLVPLPATPETMALYLTDRAESLKVATLQRRLSSISQAHQAAGFESPTKDYAVRRVWSGIRRQHGTAQQGVAPATTDVVRLMVATLTDSTIDLRNGAVVRVQFAGAFRRSELVSLDFEDYQLRRDGMVLTLRRSKTDQEGAGTLRAIPYGQATLTCPVRAMKRWLEHARIETGPLFRSVDRHGNIGGRLPDRAVAEIIKRLAEAAGLDPAQFSGHSPRAGFATSAAQAGVAERDIMKQTGHRSEKMVRKYIRDGSLFNDNAAGKVGL